MRQSRSGGTSRPTPDLPNSIVDSQEKLNAKELLSVAQVPSQGPGVQLLLRPNVLSASPFRPHQPERASTSNASNRLTEAGELNDDVASDPPLPT